MAILESNSIRSSSSSFNSPVQFLTSGGTENGTLCRAWVSFNGQGTVAIRADFNVNTIDDDGTGLYTVNFSNAMSDANYCAMVSPGNNAGGSQGAWCTIYDDATTLSGSCRVVTYSSAGSFQDTEQVFFAVFR